MGRQWPPKPGPGRKAAKPKGVPAVGTQTGTAGDPVRDFNAAIREQQHKGLSKAEAVRAVNREQPELREAMLAACN